VCGDEPAMRAIAAAREDTSLDDTDRAVLAFAGQVALDAASVTASDIDAVREVGLSDNDIADIVFAVAARSFFTRVLDGFGIQADHQLGNGFDPELRDQLVVGRPFALPNDRT
jgi:alkylhydroperoxidase family enzyme